MRPTPPLLAALATSAALGACAYVPPVLVSVEDRAIDACRTKAQADGWRVQSVEAKGREGTAYRVEVRASKLILGTRTVVCYYDPQSGRATLN